MQMIRLYLVNLRINYKTCLMFSTITATSGNWLSMYQKVLIISRGRPSTKNHFYLDRTKLEIVHEYKYLGIYLSRSGSFNTTKKYIAEQANKALFSLQRKIRSLELSFDLQIALFNKTVKPVLLYCSEIWGMGNCDIIERIQLNFLKHIFNLKRSTPTFMIYGELGITPISVEIKTRAISFWSKIVSGHDQPTRLSYQMYMVLYNMYKSNKCKSAYIENIENILNTCGFSGIWQSQDVINPNYQHSYLPTYLHTYLPTYLPTNTYITLLGSFLSYPTLPFLVPIEVRFGMSWSLFRSVSVPTEVRSGPFRYP